MQDTELFELLNFLPRDTGWKQQFYHRELTGICREEPLPHWRQWAKEFLLQPSTEWEGTDVLLRLLILAESLYPGGMERARLHESLGYLLHRVKKQRGVSLYPQVCLDTALSNSLVRQDQVDVWHPGMRSGSGWRTFYRLTLLGKSKVDISDMPPKDNEPQAPSVPWAKRSPVAPVACKPSVQTPVVRPWPRDVQPSTPAQEPVKQHAEPTPLPNDFVWVKPYVNQQVNRFFKHHANTYTERVKQVLDGTCNIQTFSKEFGPARICRWINDKHAVGADHPNPCKSQNINTSATYEACVKTFKQNPQNHAVARQLYKSDSAEIDVLLKELLGTEDSSA